MRAQRLGFRAGSAFAFWVVLASVIPLQGQVGSIGATSEASMVCGATSMMDLPVRSGTSSTETAPSTSAALSGIENSNVAPDPSALSSVMRPPMRLTMRSLMLKPRPVPP